MARETTFEGHIYRLKDGKRVSGCSTIAEYPWPSKFRIGMYWALKMVDDGKDPRQESDVDAGTLAHEFIHAYLKEGTIKNVDQSGYSPDQSNKAETAYLNFLQWESEKKIKYVASEVQLVSEQYRYGGTIDRVALVGDKESLRIIDWKVTNSIWPGHKIQLAGYINLWNENNLDRPVQGCHLIRLGKDEQAGSFQDNYWDGLPLHWEACQLLLQLYDMRKQI